MRRPTQIAAPLLAAAALSILTGCRPKEMQRCVDDKGNVVEDKLCEGQPQQAVEQRPDGHGGFIPFFFPMYRYYYGGAGGYGIGNRVNGGSYIRTPGHTYTAPSSRGGGFFGLGRGGITRGGFGSHFGSGG